MATPEMVIFDCDGVLVDSEPAANAAIAATLRAEGWAISDEEVMSLFVGGTMRSLVNYVQTKLPHIEPEAFTDRLYAVIFEALRDVDKIPGVDALLDVLDAAAIPYAVGSNGPHQKMEITLGGTGLKPRFEGRIYSREDVAQAKPEPDMFLLAAKNQGVAPENCFVIGDSRNDALAAQAAGMRFCGLAEERTAPIFRSLNADFAFDLATIRTKLGL